MPKITPMGVMNITPNSFSDGNSILTKDTFVERWKQYLKWAQIIDIGAESTAPFNASISVDEEIHRFENYFLNYLNELELPSYLSIDTYKIEVFLHVYDRIQRSAQNKVKIIFNDVSGSLDNDLIKLLNSDREFNYIYCHNLAPIRAQSSSHMDFLTTDSIVQSIEMAFDEVMNLNIDRPIYLDPCFGFSKTRVQNHELLNKFAELCKKYSNPIVYGISRKSFLRNPPTLNPKDLEVQNYLCAMEALLLADLFNHKSQQEIIVRTHGPEALSAVSFYHQIKSI